MKRILFLYFIVIVACIIAVLCVISGNLFYSSRFNKDAAVSDSYSGTMPLYKMAGAADRYAVIKYGEDTNSEQFSGSSYAALLIDNTDKDVEVAYNALRRIYPASTTKLMTAVCVCDAVESGKISLDDVVTLESNVGFVTEDAVKSQLGKGCSITVRNLLYGLLIRSYNDFAVILAEYVAGDVDSFVQLMNQKAAEIGATGCHFVNPHGLHEDDHYVTAYDMYLIINEASKYEIIEEADKNGYFSYVYTDADGHEQVDDITATNMFLSGNVTLPSNIHIKTWKTGTTRLAGSVLCMIVEIKGKEYTMFLADSIGPEDLYNKFTLLFNLAD